MYAKVLNVDQSHHVFFQFAEKGVHCFAPGCKHSFQIFVISCNENISSQNWFNHILMYHCYIIALSLYGGSFVATG